MPTNAIKVIDVVPTHVETITDQPETRAITVKTTSADSEQIPIDKIRIDGDTQPRVGIHEDTVIDYAEAMRAGSKFPAIIVFHDGTDYWLASGFHRLLAQQALEQQSVQAEVRNGTARDARLYAASTNGRHGLRRTNADKRKIVKWFLLDDEWSGWSDREISRRCFVTHPFVMKLRGSLETITSEKRRYTTKHGTDATMDTSKIGTSSQAVSNTPANDKTATNRLDDHTLHASFRLIDALDAISTMSVTPEGYCEMLPEYLAHRVNKSLDAACEWLSSFNAAWNKDHTSVTDGPIQSKQRTPQPPVVTNVKRQLKLLAKKAEETAVENFSMPVQLSVTLRELAEKMCKTRDLLPGKQFKNVRDRLTDCKRKASKGQRTGLVEEMSLALVELAKELTEIRESLTDSVTQ